MSSVRSKVLDEIANVAELKKRVLPRFDDSSPLFAIGLDSLCFVMLIIRLEDRFGANPFDDIDRDGWPVTVGDLIKVYETSSS